MLVERPETAAEIFKNNSTTYHASARFFPADTRDDITDIYGFVRKADEFIDSQPQMSEEFESFVMQYKLALQGRFGDDPIINNYVNLATRRNFNPQWTEAFIDSMRADTTIDDYDTMANLKKYMYGSAGVIGLMISQLLNLPPESNQYALKLSEAFQYINFLRDIDEDSRLGRVYIPAEIRQKHGLTDLTFRSATKQPEDFKGLMRNEVDRFFDLQKEAEPGLAYIPPRLRIAVMTSNDSYSWVANKIKKDPFIVFKGKLKPSKGFFIRRGLVNSIKVL